MSSPRAEAKSNRSDKTRATIVPVRILIAFAVCIFPISALAQQAAPDFFSVPPADAPQLAVRGTYSVGVRTIDVVHRNQIDILHFDKERGKAPVYDRSLTLEVWYPAVIPPGQREETTYEMPIPGGQTVAEMRVFAIHDQALRDAPPLSGRQFPLVIVSHGYPGSRYFMSYLTANLASKGYVVAAIDHTDSVFDQIRGFESTLLNRSNDQLFTIEALRELAHRADSFLHGLADTTAVGIIGYSMGGYGALASAGAGYSPNSALVKFVPGGYLKNWEAGDRTFQSRDRSGIKAVVAIAPWGEQPPYNAWDSRGLAAIRVPTLFIAGDHDDVADYERGIRQAFERAVNSERCLLVYENGRHNTGGNPAPPNVRLPYSILEFFDEPAWRKDRITSVNQHFITAFLDLYLKGERERGAYLHVSPAHSNEGKWAVPAGSNEKDSGAYSTGTDAQGDRFWKGFQRRNALGLEMYCSAAGEPAP